VRGYTERLKVGQKPLSLIGINGADMPRGLIFLLIVILLLVGGLFLLSRSAEEVPLQKIEADVTANAAAN
jgi:hypothetical protein